MSSVGLGTKGNESYWVVSRTGHDWAGGFTACTCSLKLLNHLFLEFSNFSSDHTKPLRTVTGSTVFQGWGWKVMMISSAMINLSSR